jgi:hypothetical protein
MNLQLSLRDLFWLVLVCALGCAWWVDRSAIIGQLKSEINRSRHLELEYDLLQRRSSFGFNGNPFGGNPFGGGRD